MRNRNWIPAVAMLLLGVATGRAEEVPKARYNVDVWGKGRSGLSGVVTAVTQTRDGYLWVGTLNGLARFDGDRFKFFNQGNTPGLKSGLIASLFEDDEGNLWAGTQTKGVALIKNGMVESLSLGKGSREGRMAAACEDTNGTVWLYTADGTLARRGKNPKNDVEWRNVPGAFYSRYRTVIAEQSGAVWIGTDAGLRRVDTEASVNSTNWPDGKDTQYLPKGLDFLLASKKGGYWIVGGERIQKWKTNHLEMDLTAYPWNRSLVSVSAACEDNEGNLVVGTSDGVWWFDAKGSAAHISEREGLSHSTVLSLCVDYEGSLWVGTDGGGLDRVRRIYFEVFEGSEGKTVQSVSEGSPGELWIGFNGAGIIHWNGKTNTEFGDAPNSYVKSVFVDRDRQVWAGTSGRLRPREGLFRFETDGFKPMILGSQVAAIFQDHNGGIWAGTLNGLGRWQDGKLKVFTMQDGLLSDSVQAIAEDAEGNLWIGTAEGLNCLRDGKFTAVHDGKINEHEDISALTVDAEGVLWIGTRGWGLERLSRGEWTHYTTEDGLISDSIGYLIEDNRTNIWMGSPAGFMRVAKSELVQFARGLTKSVTCRVYGRSDGLPTGECTFGSQPAACSTRDGRLWFPTISGLASIDPAQLGINTNRPPVRIEAVSVEGVPQITNSIRPQLPRAIIVPPGKERVDIEFTSLNLAAADKARFRYRMEGHEAAWTEVDNGTRAVHYTKLPPGDYLFHVIACNEDGIWNEVGASLAIMVQPPFWRKWWFIAGVSVFVLGAVVSLVHYLSTQKLQRQLAGMRQQQALEKERQRIARDIHDQVGANLTQVSMLGEMVESDKESPGDVEEHGRLISQTARDTAKALDEIVWAVNPSNDTLDGLITYFCKNAQEYLSVAGLRYRLDVPSQLPATPIPPDVRHNVFMAAKEAVTNVVRHAGATSAWIRLRLEPERFVLEIEDNGQGMAGLDPKRAQTRNGLSNMRKRLEEIGGSCVISPGAEGGTLVRLTAPLGKFDGGGKTV